jgi:hypothetical protein
MTFRRLFEGITLAPDDEAKARATIAKAQADVQALLPRAGPLLVLMPFNSRTVLMQAASDSALAALLTNDADRARLRERIVIAQPPLARQRP